MDQETLSNHISKLSKHLFNNACKLILEDIYQEKAVNVDGKNDGGTDFTSFKNDGTRKLYAFQVTTQKTDIVRKGYKDAKKSIEKLGANKFFYMTTYFLTEIEARKFEKDIERELDIPCICLSSNQMAGLILSENLLNRFLDESGYPLPRSAGKGVGSIDFKENALHSYTLLSYDSANLKENIYDDSILYVLGSKGPMSNDEIVEEVRHLLSLNDTKVESISKRIGALFLKMLAKNGDGKIILNPTAQNEFDSRQRIYEQELGSLTSAQIDLFRNEYGVDWGIEDSKKVAIWLADASIAEQIKNLKEAKATIITNPIFQVAENGLEKIREFLCKSKEVDKEKVEECIEKLLQLASNHPLITKISRASIYIALEGANPVSSAKALGANRWSDFNILIEPTVAIPYCCSILYKGFVNKYFDLSVRAIKRAIHLDCQLYIPYFYINECAGHLLQARKYNDIELNEEELKFSSNAFVANYYSLKSQGVSVPSSFLDYLCTFSSSIKTERKDIKEWIRSIMSDIQSLLNKNNVEFVHTPTYDHDYCAVFEREYSHYLLEFKLDKPTHLVNHDIWALQFTNDEIVKENQHWIVLSYDRSLISVSRADTYKGWITNPSKFLDFSENSKPLSEAQLTSLVHSVATYSERTLSIGARIIDRIIRYASSQIQNWEFKQDLEIFKKEVIESFNSTSFDYAIEIDKKTDEFLKSKGIVIEIDENTDVDI